MSCHPRPQGRAPGGTRRRGQRGGRPGDAASIGSDHPGDSRGAASKSSESVSMHRPGDRRRDRDLGIPASSTAPTASSSGTPGPVDPRPGRRYAALHHHQPRAGNAQPAQRRLPCRHRSRVAGPRRPLLPRARPRPSRHVCSTPGSSCTTAPTATSRHTSRTACSAGSWWTPRPRSPRSSTSGTWCSPSTTRLDAEPGVAEFDRAAVTDEEPHLRRLQRGRRGADRRQRPADAGWGERPHLLRQRRAEPGHPTSIRSGRTGTSSTPRQRCSAHRCADHRRPWSPPGAAPWSS